MFKWIKKKAPSSNSRKRASTAPKKILVFESNELNQNLLIDLLGAHGYVTSHTGDDLDVVRLMREFRPHLIVIGINSTSISETNVLKRVERDEYLKNIPAIALPVDALKKKKEQLISAGFKTVIPKPITVTIFLEVISKILAGEAVRSYYGPVESAGVVDASEPSEHLDMETTSVDSADVFEVKSCSDWQDQISAEEDPIRKKSLSILKELDSNTSYFMEDAIKNWVILNGKIKDCSDRQDFQELIAKYEEQQAECQTKYAQLLLTNQKISRACEVIKDRPVFTSTQIEKYEELAEAYEKKSSRVSELNRKQLKLYRKLSKANKIIKTEEGSQDAKMWSENKIKYSAAWREAKKVYEEERETENVARDDFHKFPIGLLDFDLEPSQLKDSFISRERTVELLGEDRVLYFENLERNIARYNKARNMLR